MNRKLPTILVSLMLATGAAACGGDDEANDGGGGQSDSPVNTDTPADNETVTPAPNDGGQGETDGE